VAKTIETLTGEETLVACWGLLACLSPNTHVTRSPAATVAVFGHGRLRRRDVTPVATARIRAVTHGACAVGC
jgi:hypothetical protein